MIWVLIGISLYVLAGILVVCCYRASLYMEVASQAFKDRRTPKFKQALIVIYILSVFIWPFVLTGLKDNKNRWSYIYDDISFRFRSVSRDRGEELGVSELSTIAHKFLRVYEQFGAKMYKSHLEYELKKYREDGLREDYSK